MSNPPDFSSCLVLAIELLKRDAPSVDLVHLGVRLRKHGRAMEIGPIPQSVIDSHAEMFAAAAPQIQDDPPIDGVEGTNARDQGGPTEVGAASENA
jgi:hypothetical protein